MRCDTPIRTLLQALICCLLAFVCLLACSGKTPPPATTGESRIVSLSPAFSETLVHWGLLDQIVGIDQFSNVPGELNDARKAGKIALAGDAMNPSYEAILALRPTLVLGEATSFAHRYDKLKDFGLRVETLPMESLSQMLSSFRQLGKLVGKEAEAEREMQELETLFADSETTRGTILLTYNAPSAGDIQCIGRKGYQSEIAQRLGWQNVLKQDLSFITLSHEQLLGLQPDLIIQISFQPLGQGLHEAWQGVKELTVVKERKIFELAFPEAQQQGLPSIRLLIEAMKNLTQ